MHAENPTGRLQFVFLNFSIAVFDFVLFLPAKINTPRREKQARG